jgi:hypothetical protein
VEVSMVEAVAEVTMVTAAAIPTAATMAVAITVGADTMDTMVATVGTAATDGMADIGAIHTTVTAGAGDLALGGRIGVGDGDTRMATATALGITLPTVTITRRIALRATHALPTETTTLRHETPAQNLGATQQSLGDRR